MVMVTEFMERIQILGRGKTIAFRPVVRQDEVKEELIGKE